MRGQMSVHVLGRAWAPLEGRPQHPDNLAGGHHCRGSGCISPHRSGGYPLCLSSLLSFLFWGEGKGLTFLFRMHTLFSVALSDAFLLPPGVRVSCPVLGAEIVTTQVYQGR